MNLDFTRLLKDFKDNGYNDLDGVTDEKKMLYLYSYYHYFYGDSDSIFELNEGCDYRKNLNNCAQAFFETTESGDNELHIISTLWVDGANEFNIDQVKYNLSEVESMLSQIKFGSYYSDNTNVSKLRDYFDKSFSDKVKIILLTNALFDGKEKNKIRETIVSLPTKLENVSFDIVFGDDIQQEIDDINAPKDVVDSSYINIEPNNYLKYGDEGSFICNVSALSIKQNYQKYAKSGLFAQNLRFYVKQPKIDDSITNSIQNKGDKFWYLNNGIIIICDDYKIEGDKVYLTNFSVINGGQTTRMIGVTEFDKDFYIMCKVIKNKYVDDKDKVQFVSDIAEATNSQKPIKPIDLVANKPEQRLLKTQLNEANIFCEIKRGEKPNNPKVNYPEPWQKTKNDEIAQLLYSFIYQKPGAARNNKAELCLKDNVYKIIFGKQYDTALIKDLLIIRSVYKKWTKQIVDDMNIDPVKKGLAKNGLYFMLAAIGAIAKLAYSKDYTKAMLDAVGDDEKKKAYLGVMIFNHRVLNCEYKECEKKLINLFNVVYERYYSNGFNLLRSVKPDLAYSNFTKVDSNYYAYVFKAILDDFYGDIHNALLSVLVPVFYKPNNEELELNNNTARALVKYYEENKNVVSTDDDPLLEKLKNDLTDYRIQKSKEKNTKMIDIFTNKELDIILKVLPFSTDDMLKYGCFKTNPKTKIHEYGDDIVKIIKSIYKKGE